jgi:hypothetical protein
MFLERGGTLMNRYLPRSTKSSLLRARTRIYSATYLSWHHETQKARTAMKLVKPKSTNSKLICAGRQPTFFDISNHSQEIVMLGEIRCLQWWAMVSDRLLWRPVVR